MTALTKEFIDLLEFLRKDHVITKDEETKLIRDRLGVFDHQSLRLSTPPNDIQPVEQTIEISNKIPVTLDPKLFMKFQAGSRIIIEIKD